MIAPPTNIKAFVCIPFFTCWHPLANWRRRKVSKGCRPVEKGMQTKTLMFVGGAIICIYQSKPWFGGFRSTLDIASSTWEPDGLGILYQLHLSSCEHPQAAVTCWMWNISHDPQQAQLSGLLSLKEHYCVVKRLNHWMVDWKVFWVNCLMRLILCIRRFAAFEQWYMSKQSTLLLFMQTLVSMQTLCKWLGNQLPRASFSFDY